MQGEKKKKKKPEGAGMGKNIHFTMLKDEWSILERRMTTHVVMAWWIILKINEMAVWIWSEQQCHHIGKIYKGVKMIKPLCSTLKNTVLKYVMFVQNKH